jgi:hypothetical protein
VFVAWGVGPALCVVSGGNCFGGESELRDGAGEGQRAGSDRLTGETSGERGMGERRQDLQHSVPSTQTAEEVARARRQRLHSKQPWSPRQNRCGERSMRDK